MKIWFVALLLILVALTIESVQADVYYPVDDKTCISDGINWYYAVNCTDEFVNNPYSPNVWTIYVGQDFNSWNDEGRTVFKFIYNLSSNSVIENATFCAYVYWGQCNQVAPKYVCGLGDVYVSHIYISGEIDIWDYNSTMLGTEKIWLPDQNGAPIGSGRYWCVDATDWVADDVANGRGSTSVRLHITNHHPIVDVSANSVRIYSRLSSVNPPYLEVKYSSPPIPVPTNRSVIITDSDWKNVISVAGVKVPVIMAENGNITPEIGRFLEEYGPDFIYVIGFSAGLNNSFEISKEKIPDLFFPDAGRTVYASSREKGIFASLIGSYLGWPVVFDKNGNYSILDLENMSVQEIQDFYVSSVKSSGENIDYLVLTNFQSRESLLAGRLAGLRKGYIVPVNNTSFEAVKANIKDVVGLLGSSKLFHKNFRYRLGEPLYLGILGGNESVPYVWFFDPGLEIFDDKDGWWLYSDLGYADVDGDGFFELAVGRMEGLEATSLQMAREYLPKNQSVVLVGEYRYPKFADLKFFGGGMSQTFLTQAMLESVNVSAKRIVEERIGLPGQSNESISKAIEGAAGFISRFALKKSLEAAEKKIPEAILGRMWSIADYSDMMMYAILEFDWYDWNWLMGIIPVPKHLDVIDENLQEKVGAPGIVGYFGFGEEWTIPKKERSYWGMLLWPYDGSEEFTNFSFGGFLYNDHDISARSGITENVKRNGGSVVGSSGIIHDPYAMRTSTFFFMCIAQGKPLGQALIESANMDPVQGVLGLVALYRIYSAGEQEGSLLTYPLLYIKDSLERILYGDPAVRPVSRHAGAQKTVYSVGPHSSFLAESWIESNYTIENGGMRVWNADDYLVESEKSVIPLFVKEFVLPENSVVNWVNVSGKYSLKSAIPDIVYNDSYYTNYTEIILDCVESLNLSGLDELNRSQEELVLECVENLTRPEVDYPYPNSTFWWNSHSMLDNRTLVYVFVSAILYENDSSGMVLENASVEVDYEAAVEMNVIVQDVLFGENGTVKVEFMNMGVETSGTLWIFVEGNGSLEFSEDVTVTGNSALERQFSFASSLGDYETTAVFESESGSIGPRYGYFSVREKPTEIAVPEVDESEQVFLIKPGRYSGRIFTLENSGNTSLEMEISCEGLAEISCMILPDNLTVLPGEEKFFSINVSVPCGYPSGIYEGKIVLVGNEIAQPKIIEIPVEVDVPEVAYWSVSSLEWVCDLPNCERNFSVSNSPDSNALFEADINVEGLNMISIDGNVSVEVGSGKNLSASIKIPPEGIPSGTYAGKIILEGDGNAEPSEQEIDVTVLARGPQFTIKKEFQPEKIILFWKQFMVPKINRVEIYLNNTGEIPIEKINMSDEIPDGWKGKKPVLAFVKRNRQAPAKEFSYSYANGYANFSFNFSEKPLKKGEGLEVNYIIYAQPEFAPTENIITTINGVARSHENVYSREASSAILKVEHFSPPSWLRWLFVLVHGLR